LRRSIPNGIDSIFRLPLLVFIRGLLCFQIIKMIQVPQTKNMAKSSPLIQQSKEKSEMLLFFAYNLHLASQTTSRKEFSMPPNSPLLKAVRDVKSITDEVNIFRNKFGEQKLKILLTLTSQFELECLKRKLLSTPNIAVLCNQFTRLLGLMVLNYEDFALVNPHRLFLGMTNVVCQHFKFTKIDWIEHVRGLCGEGLIYDYRTLSSNRWFKIIRKLWHRLEPSK